MAPSLRPSGYGGQGTGTLTYITAGMAEQADAHDSKSCGIYPMRVRVSLPAPNVTCSEMTAPRGEYAALRRAKCMNSLYPCANYSM